MKYLYVVFAFFSWLLVACPDPNAPTSPTRDLVDHAARCTARGEGIIGRDLATGEVCETTRLRLQALVDFDPDCRAYFGDASVSVDLCEHAGDPSRESPDGGAP